MIRQRFGKLIPMLCGVLIGYLNGCGSGNIVTVYVAVDQDYSEPIIQAFQQQHPEMEVRAVYDSEITKTTGLYERIVHERRNPQADVFWNNEVFRTVQLKQQGILQPYESPSAQDIDPKYKDPEHCWTGFSARARVMIIHADLVPESETPANVPDLGDFRYAGKTGMANPQFGTTAGHMAALYTKLGAGVFKIQLRRYVDNRIQFLPGNAVVRDQVAAGQLAYGLTDSDDAYAAIDDGKPVRMAFLGQKNDGTLIIPNTVAMLNGAPHPENAQRLIDYLLSPEVEKQLAFTRAKQIPIRPEVERPDGLPLLSEIKTMEVDYEATAKNIEACIDLFREYIK